MQPVEETSMHPRLWPLVRALGIAFGVSLMLAGCDDVEVGGVGASVGLPSAFVSSNTDPTDIGVGNVHWVGNPRW